MTWTWLGIVAVIFLAMSCLTGYRHGFIKEIVSTFFIILAMLLVWVVNPYVNEFIRENTPVYEKVQTGCQELVEAQSGDAAGLNKEEQSSLIDGLALPEFFKEGLEENNTASVYQYLAVSTFAEYISGYLALAVVNGLSFLVSFVLVTLLIRMVTYALSVIARLPLLNGANKTAGAALGLAKGVVFIWIALLVLTVLCNTEIGKAGLALVEKDTVLSWLYEKDIFLDIFMNIFYGNA